MNTALKRTLLSTLIVPFAIGASTASAAKINVWDYDVDSAFDNATFTAANGVDDGSTDTSNENVISWGGVDADDRSSVAIEDVVGGTGLVTDGAAVAGGSFSHDNNIINAEYVSLTGFDLTSTLTLQPSDPAGPALPPTSITFLSFFSETFNEDVAADCGFPSTSACDDIFTLDNFGDLGAVPNGMGGFEFISSFILQDYKYTVFLELAGLSVLDDDACLEAGAQTGCVGLLTEEDSLNTFDTSFRITAQKVPEPGTLALLGLGLAGLGLSRRKKAAKA